MNATVSKRHTWILLWICLILLNVIIRYPITPHEIGSDSFIIHFIADSISKFGHAKWWYHPLSIIGLYPYSFSSALPFYLSGVSQSISMEMERTIWIVLSFFGIFSSFTAYLMAGAIRDDEKFKFLTALVYSTSTGILVFTTWNASSRGLFIVMLPLFVYFLIRSRFSLKYGLLTGVLFLLLMAIHNFFYLVIPIIIIFCSILIINHLIYKLKSIEMDITIPNQLKYIFIVSMMLMIFIVLLIQSFIKYSFEDQISIIFSYVRYSGVLIIFAIGGSISLLFKSEKKFEEWFLLLVIISFIPFLPIEMYAKFFMLPFIALLISSGIMNSIAIRQKRKIALSIVIIFLLLSVSFATFYQFGRTDISDQYIQSKFWSEESTVNAAIWTKLYTNEGIFSDQMSLSRRILAYSGVSMLSETEVIHSIQSNLDEYEFNNMSMRSPFSTLFYFEGPFYLNSSSSSKVWYWNKLRNENINSKWGKIIIQRFNLNYYIGYEGRSTTFSRSIIQQKDKLFDNGRVSIWWLEGRF
jgi:hypothetical protein